jgi:hypothetical protein
VGSGASRRGRCGGRTPRLFVKGRFPASVSDARHHFLQPIARHIEIERQEFLKYQQSRITKALPW